MKTDWIVSALAFQIAACWALAPSVDGQCTPVAGSLGCVTVEDAGACASGPSPLAGTNTCKTLRIECADTPALDVELRINEPASGTSLRGTVVLGTRGTGTLFFEDDVGGDVVVAELAADGFRVVQRRWAGPAGPGGSGWIQLGTCVRASSCLYATLLDWVYENVHTSGAFAAVGTSGGAGEVGYALSTWGMSEILDLAVLAGGPPFVRLDYVCNDATPWPTLCQTVLPTNMIECSAPGEPPCLMVPGPGLVTCRICDPAPSDAHLREDSILHSTAVTHYATANPSHETRVHFIVGSKDCQSVPARMAALYHDSVTSQKVLQFLTQTPHIVTTEPRGQDAVVRAVLAGTATPATPATISPDSWPVLGGSVGFDLHGPDFGAAVVLFDVFTAKAELPGLGWYFLEKGFVLRVVGLDAQGRGFLSVTVPGDPAFADVEVFLQTLVADGSPAFVGLSNLTSVVLRP